MRKKFLAFTTDIWTSRATEAYMMITAHYISDEWKLESNVLCTSEIAERHTGANIASRIQEVLEVEYSRYPCECSSNRQCR